MRLARKPLLITLLAAGLAAATLLPARGRQGYAVTIATWNLEWLVAPATAHAARLACRSGSRALLPCDVADGARDSADIARLAAYARRLDADIVAFQEVEDESIASRVFPGYLICMADGKGAQHVGFAVRPRVRHRCGPAEDSVSAGDRGRKGMVLHWLPETGEPVELLVVHLKSGCSRDPLDSDTAACRLLAEQAQRLGQWVADRSAAGTDFIVLGDFNRLPPVSAGDAFWEQVQTAPLHLVADELRFTNCFPGQPFSGFIDHLLVSNNLVRRIVPDSPVHVPYATADAARYHLSDHCPVSISLTWSSDNAASDELSSVAR